MSQSESETHDTSGPKLKYVLGTVMVLVLVLGTLAYQRYAASETHFAAIMAEMDERGKELDAEGCVDAIIEWNKNRCDANKPLCDNGVPQVMSHCLMARERPNLCGDLEGKSSKGQWVFNSCKDRGTACRIRKRCACADAYRTIDSYCRHGGQGVSL